MRRYDSYKDSGIDWLGDIPSHWKINFLTKSLESLVDFRGKTPRKLEIYEDGGMFLVTARNIKNGNIDYSLSEEYVDEIEANVLLNRGKLNIGDVLFTTEAPLGEVANIDNDKVALAQRIIKFRGDKKKLNNYYLKYWIFSNQFNENLKRYATGSTVLGIKGSKIRLLHTLLPPLHEQQAIANYLDAKTQAIDKKVTLLEQKIETYKKLKRTLINQTITKGLDKNVPLKDSGIAWIGQIPQHWEVKRLKDVSKSMSSGATPTSGNLSYYEDGTINWLNTGDLNDGIINTTQKKLNNSVFDDYPNLKIQKKGTLVIAMYGATIGKMGLLNIESTTNQACCCIDFKNDNFNKFHFYQLLNIKQFIISLSVGGTQPNVSQGILSFIKLVIPPKSEQEEIAKYLDHKTATIDAIVDNIGKQIDTLKQLRKTLINDVVTGKIKVVE